MIRRGLLNNETAAPAMTQSVEDEDRRRNPVKRVASTRSEEVSAEMSAEMSAEISAR